MKTYVVQWLPEADDDIDDVFQEFDQAFRADIGQEAELMRDAEQSNADRDNDRQRHEILQVLEKDIYDVFAMRQDLFRRAVIVCHREASLN